MSREVQVRFCESRAVRSRPATHLVVCCGSRGQAERALARLTGLLAELGLRPKPAKTRIVHLTEGGLGLDFLGFHHRLVRARGRSGARRFTFLARWPSRQAERHARDRIRQLTGRSRLAVPVEQVVREVNAFLRGWSAFFKYGNSSRVLSKVSTFALSRLALFVAYQTPDRLGLISLQGTVVAPRPVWGWRVPTEHRR